MIKDMSTEPIFVRWNFLVTIVVNTIIKAINASINIGLCSKRGAKSNAYFIFQCTTFDGVNSEPVLNAIIKVYV
mgnify:CR=1 FL=1